MNGKVRMAGKAQVVQRGRYDMACSVPRSVCVYGRSENRCRCRKSKSTGKGCVVCGQESAPSDLAVCQLAGKSSTAVCSVLSE